MRAVFDRKDKFTIFGGDYPTPDGSCIRDYIHVLDLAEAHIASLKYLKSSAKSNYFNVGTGRGYSNWEIVNAVKKIIGRDFKVEVSDRRAADPATLVVNNRKILKTLKWKPQYSDLRTIIDTAYKWHKTHPFSLED